MRNEHKTYVNVSLDREPSGWGILGACLFGFVLAIILFTHL